MTKGIVVPHDAEAALEVREFSEFGDYQQAVGGWIEAIDIPSLGIMVFVNEEGLLKHLPLNSRMTFLWWFQVPEARQRAMLVGDAVIVGARRGRQHNQRPGDGHLAAHGDPGLQG